MSIYDIKENPVNLSQKDIDRSHCFNKLEKDCRGPCMGGLGGLTFGSQKRCDNCVADKSSIHPCNAEFGREFSKNKGKKLRSGRNTDRLKSLFKRRGNPDELVLNYPKSGDNEPEPVNPGLPKQATKKQIEEAKEMEARMNLRDKRKYLERRSSGGIDGSKRRKDWKKQQRSRQQARMGNPVEGEYPVPVGGARKKRKKTKRRKKSRKTKKSRRTRRQRR